MMFEEENLKLEPIDDSTSAELWSGPCWDQFNHYDSSGTTCIHDKCFDAAGTEWDPNDEHGFKDCFFEFKKFEFE